MALSKGRNDREFEEPAFRNSFHIGILMSNDGLQLYRRRIAIIGGDRHWDLLEVFGPPALYGMGRGRGVP